MSRVELELEKHISKLEGQLASAQYALRLMRNGGVQTTAGPDEGPMLTIAKAEPEVIADYSRGIPLFS